MSDIPLSMKLNCKSLFRSFSNTVMHTDNYNATALLLDVCFNKIYLELRERERTEKTEMKKGRDGNKNNSKNN